MKSNLGKMEVTTKCGWCFEAKESFSGLGVQFWGSGSEEVWITG